MNSNENNEVAVEKIENDKSAADAKCKFTGTKRAAEDNTEKVKKARKEENGGGSESEDLNEEEEGAKREEDDEDEDKELEGQDFKFLKGEDDTEDDVEFLKKGNLSNKMSKMIKLDVTQAGYEGLRCSVCSGYLSLAPIRLLPDGRALCCHCAPPNNVVPYRALIVENLLSEATFPCRYKQFGCTTNVQFNKVVKHEEGCIHRPFPCASLPYTNCSWKGSVSQITSHFAEKHAHFVQQEAKIKLNISQNKEDMLLVNGDLGSFIIKYAFNSTMSSLTYRINLCMMDVDDQNCKLQLFNDLDLDYCLTLKAKCFTYNKYLCNDNLLNVDMKSILAALNNPKSFTVVFHVKLPTLTNNSSPNTEVDYKLLDSNRCARCQYFLVPPLFELENKIICGDCSYVKGCKRTTDKTLENLLIQKHFPCRWKDCNFIGKGDIIGRHQTECDFRMYHCPQNCNKCRAVFSRSNITSHMTSHCTRYKTYINFSNEYTCGISENGTPRYLYTFVDNEIIIIEMYRITVILQNEGGIKFFFRVTLFSENNMVGTVYFSHDHCKCQSKMFSFSSQLLIDISDLPKCFRSNVPIYATIKIKNY